MRKLVLTLLALAGCYLGRYPVTPSVAAPEVFEVFTAEGTGTGFAISHHFAVTAGHVCYLALPSDTVWLKAGRTGIPAKVVAFEVTPDASGDLCVVHTDADLGPGLILADHAPALGAADTIIGYPLGSYAITHGNVIGPASTTAHHDHGNSGSPLFTDRGVYGVVVDAGPAQCSVSELKRFLDEVGVSYDITPPDPNDNQFPPEGGLG